VSSDQLVIQRESPEEVTIPLEDISVLLIDTYEVTLSVSVLSRLAAYGGIVVGCGDNHIPSVISIPTIAHSRQTAIQRIQIEATKPFLKRCWQKIVKQKILNQAEVLGLCGLENKKEELISLIPSITSGDSMNVESNAARIYFRALFGGDFIRGSQGEGIGKTNSLLNYGYAVLRSTVAQAIVCHGLLPAFGMHHKSELNPFNLADDIIEPFRPIVDLYAANFKAEDNEPIYELTPDDKAGLIALLHNDVKIDGKKYACMYAIDLCVAGYQKAVLGGEASILTGLPTIIPLKKHRYE